MYEHFFKIIIIFSVISPLKIYASTDDKKVVITLTNGDTLNGTLIESKSTNDAKFLDHPQLGELNIRESIIKNFKLDVKNTEDKTNKTVEKNTSASSISNNNIPKLKSNDEISKWSGSISIGLDDDIGHEDFSRSLDLDLSIDLTNEKSIYTNTISFDWTKDESQYEIGGAYNVSDSLEIDQKTSMDISNNMEIYYSNNYDYNSDASYGKNSLISSIGLTKGFFDSDDTSLSISAGPAIHFVYGGDECDITTDCGETYLSSVFSINFSNKLSKKFELEINNIFSSSYASTAIYGNELSSTLTFRPSDSSGFNTSFEYQNDYREFSNPKFEDKYSLNVGYDF
tara:strand:+ start:1093 stop:2115 length:1023 start_codon:yes stop_codon:yes gene_type:complete